MNMLLTREEVLTLMKDLPTDYWLQGRLLEELNKQTTVPEPQLNPPLPVVAHVTWMRQGQGQCEWETYGIQCEQFLTAVDTMGHVFCEEHTGLTCRNCGKVATHGCPEELQFVCGTPLCENCVRCDHQRYW